MLAGRMEYFFNFRKDKHEFAPDGIEYEFKRLHYDTANATAPASMAALLKLVPASQVVFGTDYPYVPIGPQERALHELGLTAGQLRGIESGNAERLIPRLKA
jgi:predicted TIM-barrel fold metal-dependent hydrolase